MFSLDAEEPSISELVPAGIEGGAHYPLGKLAKGSMPNQFRKAEHEVPRQRMVSLDHS
jgi:hypothetical protein